DTIWLGSNLTPAEIVLRRTGNKLVLKIAGTTDTLTVQDFFRSDTGLNRVERIEFMEGTAWDVTEIFARAYAPSEYDDYIYGTNGDDNLSGGGGNDTLYGQAGNDTVQGDSGGDRLYGGPGADTLDGGTGNDTLEGGTGNETDTYLFNRGSGQDTVVETDTTPGNTDTILLGEGILSAEIRVERMGNDLRLTISETDDSITIKNWAQADVPGFAVESVRFADGTEWDTDRIADLVVQGTAANDTLTGFTRADFMEGSSGDDTLFARVGDDTVNGGDGSDTLYGETGNDTIARDQLNQNRSFSWTEGCSEWYM
ncbi:MAG: calcium-binding protein, partial [Deltaproteobacteria bacterium]|nr:calcium-binding protein [Deltaproteobacteria bacterium]